MSSGINSLKGVREHLFRKHRGLCFYCGIEMTRSGCNRISDFCVDHVIPLKRGGKDTYSNVVACCGGCNTSKGNKTPDEWYQSLIRKDNHTMAKKVKKVNKQMSEFGKKSYKALVAKYGPNHMSDMAKAMWKKRRAAQRKAERAK